MSTLAELVPFAVAHWTLNEQSGTRFDSVGSNDLTDNNTVGFDTGKFGNAADFVTANDEYLSVADNADLSMGNIDFTIRFWVKLDNKSTSHDLIAKWDAGINQREYIINYASGSDRFTLFISDDGTATTHTTSVTADNFGSPSIDTWYLIHAWHDATNDVIGISVNAGTANTAAWTTGIFDGSQAFQLGRRPGSTGVSNLDGKLDDVVVLKGVVMDATQRTLDYNGGTGIPFPLWKRKRRAFRILRAG